MREREASDIKKCVFQGGSVRGYAYGGALDALEKQCVKMSQIGEVAGTSAGAITAFLCALGCTAKEINEGMGEVFSFEYISENTTGKTESKVSKTFTWPRFLAPKAAVAASPKVARNIIKDYGVIDTEVFRQWFEKKAFEKTGIRNITFAELANLAEKHPEKGFKKLHVVGTNLNEGRAVVFSHNSQDNAMPYAIISHAVTISMSIPGIFKPRHIWFKKKEKLFQDPKKHFYVDGGVLDNFPLWIFKDQLDETLGFRLMSKKMIDYLVEGDSAPSKEITSTISFAMALYQTIRNKENSDFEKNDACKAHTIYIDTVGVDTLDLNLSDESKKKLYDSGFSAVETAFQASDSLTM